MKLAVIGGGGVRSMFLAKSIAGRAEKMGIKELVFMDNNEKKLNIYGKMAREVSRRLCPALKFTPTTDGKEAIADKLTGNIVKEIFTFIRSLFI